MTKTEVVKDTLVTADLDAINRITRIIERRYNRYITEMRKAGAQIDSDYSDCQYSYYDSKFVHFYGYDAFNARECNMTVPIHVMLGSADEFDAVVAAEVQAFKDVRARARKMAEASSARLAEQRKKAKETAEQKKRDEIFREEAAKRGIEV